MNFANGANTWNTLTIDRPSRRQQLRHNIRAAVSHCADLGLTDVCWDLAGSAHEFYTRGSYFDDWQATHTTAVQACREAEDLRGEGVMLTSLGQPALVASRRTGVSSVAELERAVALLADCGDRHGQAIALRTLANALRRRGHLARPLALFKEALACYEASADTVGRWLTMRYIGQAYPRCWPLRRGAPRAADELGEQHPLAQTRYWIGQARLASGDLPRAAGRVQRGSRRIQPAHWHGARVRAARAWRCGGAD